MDIQWTQEGIRFSVRSSVLLKDCAHKQVLLTYMRAVKDHDAFLLPGGRMELLESSTEAARRELQEELGIEVDCTLISIQENIAAEAGFHMLELIHYGEVKDFASLSLPEGGWDRFYVAKIRDIDPLDIRPPALKSLIRQEQYGTIDHSVNPDWL